MKTSLFRVALVSAACTLAVSAAHGQTAIAGAGSQSQSGAQAGSSSGSQAIINMPSNPADTSATVTTNSTSNASQLIRQEVSGSQTLKNVPNIAMSGPASGPCTGWSGGLAIAVPGGGGGVNFAKPDPGCEDRETARLYGMLGEKDKALMILDNSESMLRTQAAMRARDKQAAAPTPAPVTLSAGNGDICTRARAVDDKALAARVCN